MDPAATGFRRALRTASHGVSRFFPMPELLAPRSAGIDISDASIKWLVLKAEGDGYRVEQFGEEPLQDGIVINGAIKDPEALVASLRAVKKHFGGIKCAHAALPEEAAYVFEMHVPEGTSHAQALQMVEFELEGRVPIPPEAAVYDFDVIERRDKEGEDVGVVVFPRELAESYAAVFRHAGIALLSLEVEAMSIARAVSSGDPSEPITLLVDFGRARTGFAVLKHGIPIFTSTVEVGGEAINHVLAERSSLSPQDAIAFRNEEGLLAVDRKSAGAKAALDVATALADEVSRHYHYWDTRRNEHGDRMTPVGQIMVVGGSANLKGLPDFLSGKLQAPAMLGNVWRNVCDLDHYIPPIDRRASLQYATAIGLALRAFSI